MDSKISKCKLEATHGGYTECCRLLFSILSLEYKCCCFFSIEVVLNLLAKIWDRVSAKKVSIAKKK